MLLGRVFGTVVATTVVEGMGGVPFRWVQPEHSNGSAAGSALIACDATRQADEGQLVYLIDGKEATIPLPDSFVPADVTIVGIVDRLDLVNGSGDATG